MRVAAFDCGTNSLRMLIADLDPATGEAVEIAREMRVVRLGEGVDQTGRISDAAMTRVFAATDEYLESVRRHAPEAIRFCATSAARDAENAEEFSAGIAARVGVVPEVLDGRAEAEASYTGATRSLPDLAAPVLVVDIGGGSTEFVLGDGSGAIQHAQSLNVGSVRLTERHHLGDPPTPDQIAAVREDVNTALDTLDLDLTRAGTVVGVAGTITTMAAACLGLQTYQRDRIHRAVIETTRVKEQLDELLAMTIAQRRELGYMHPGRADVIGTGGLILVEILRRAQAASLVVSELDILDGIAWSMVDQET
jgi:exopolyphosphatase/guanosine-5'-triphosphate,3'-diphosphate pyrophosphatase